MTEPHPKLEPAAAVTIVLVFGPALAAVLVGLITVSWRWFGVTAAGLYLVALLVLLVVAAGSSRKAKR